MAGQTFDVKLLIRSNKREFVDSYTQSSQTEVVFYEDYGVATATTDGTVSLGSITTADHFYIESDQAITFKLNGGTTAHTLDAGKFWCTNGTAITALTVSNASGSTAYLKILFAGA